mgnify:CR=1 FL=1
MARTALRRTPLVCGLVALLLATALASGAAPVRAAAPVFSAPLAGPPGPGSWFVAQWYGNTVWSRDNPYPAGQGLHFGIDFNTPCGTTVLAIGDGTVFAVDGPYGSAPHNVVIEHGDGIFSLYGHLLARSTLAPGQPVRTGDPIAVSGDPAGRCDLDPHLHLEIRRNMMRETTNPVPFLRIDWQRATAGIRRNGTTFVRDLDNPDRWMLITDQPDVVFGGPRLNEYRRGWP